MFNTERFRSLRLKMGYTHQELADLLGVNVRMIQRYESEGNPRSDVLSRMATVFNVSTDYLLGLTDNPLPNINQGELTAPERAALAAWRSGERLQAVAIIASDQQDSVIR